MLSPVRRLLLILPMLLLGQSLCCQGIPLYRNGSGGGLFLDPDYIWRYNLYEHSRWGLGLVYSADSAQSWHAVANAGYGLHDKQLKWGLGAGRLICPRHNGRLYLMATREYAAAGNRHMQWASIYVLDGLASFMSLRMSDQISAIAGYRWTGRDYSFYVVDMRLFRGGRLFDNNGLLYRKDGDTIAPENGVELRFGYTNGGFNADAIVGRTWPAQKTIAQLLVEYDHTFLLSPFALRLYTQAGVTPPNTPYIYMFDLGGTFGAPLYFRNTMLTIMPCEYTANAFTLGSLRLAFEKPLFQAWNSVLVVGTYPRPFVGVTAAWGMMWGQTDNGTLTYEGLDLQAPNRAVAEAVVGIDGLLRWGYVDYGAALAVSLLPDRSRTAILLTAGLHFN